MRFADLIHGRFATPLADKVLYASGVAALVGIPLVLLVPSTGPLMAFLLVTIWVNGPASPFLPATYEPILMLFGRVYSPWLVSALGIAGTLYVEFLNYHLYSKVLRADTLTPIRRTRAVNWISARYSRAPFFTIWLCSWSPLPYWAVRFLSPLVGYPVGRHLWATFLGRFPRLWFFAALGTWWDIDSRALFAVTLASIAIAVAVWAIKYRGGASPAFRGQAPASATPTSAVGRPWQ